MTCLKHLQEETQRCVVCSFESRIESLEQLVKSLPEALKHLDNAIKKLEGIKAESPPAPKAEESELTKLLKDHLSDCPCDADVSHFANQIRELVKKRIGSLPMWQAQHDSINEIIKEL